MASDSLVEVLELENLLVQILCVRLTQKAASGICWPEPIVGLEYSFLRVVLGHTTNGVTDTSHVT